METNHRTKKVFFNKKLKMIIVSVALILISLSTITTALGFNLVFKIPVYIGWILSIFIGLVMFVLLVSVINKGKNLLAMLVIYCILATFSFWISANYFFDNTMQIHYTNSILQSIKNELTETVKIIETNLQKRNLTTNDSIAANTDNQSDNVNLRCTIIKDYNTVVLAVDTLCKSGTIKSKNEIIGKAIELNNKMISDTKQLINNFERDTLCISELKSKVTEEYGSINRFVFKKASKQAKSALILSFVISFLLEFPLLLVILTLRF